jgi:hypothetical protein
MPDLLADTESTDAARLPTVLGGVEQSLHELSRACDAAVGPLISSPGRHEAELAAALQDAGAALRTAAEACARARELMWMTMGAPERAAA